MREKSGLSSDSLMHETKTGWRNGIFFCGPVNHLTLIWAAYQGLKRDRQKVRKFRPDRAAPGRKVNWKLTGKRFSSKYRKQCFGHTFDNGESKMALNPISLTVYKDIVVLFLFFFFKKWQKTKKFIGLILIIWVTGLRGLEWHIQSWKHWNNRNKQNGAYHFRSHTDGCRRPLSEWLSLNPLPLPV